MHIDITQLVIQAMQDYYNTEEGQQFIQEYYDSIYDKAFDDILNNLLILLELEKTATEKDIFNEIRRLKSLEKDLDE